jgi:probable phosphoglycerate mutase
MGGVKALLPLDGVPAVLRVAGSYASVGVEPIVVLGDHADRIAAVLAESRVRHVVNRDFATGMYSSVRRGVRALPADTSAFFVHPVDCALVRPETLGLIARTADLGAAVTYPINGGTRGHPPLVAARLRGTIAASDPDGGLQALLRSRESAATDVAVGDPHILLDMDDRAAYERLCRLAERERLPDPEVCRELEERHGTPAPVVAHAETVAAVAGRLGSTLRAVGVCLDLRLLEAAALLHDLARAEPRHAEVAAAVLDVEGYPRVASVVRHHMDLPVVPAVPGEAELLYLADKLTVGAEIADLARKRGRAEARFAGDAAALAAARRRLDAAGVVAAQVERLAGLPLAEVVAGAGRSTAGGALAPADDADAAAGRP